MKRMMALLLILTMLTFAMPAFAAGGEVPYERIVAFCMNLRELAHGDFMTLKGVPDDIQGTARAWTDAIDETPDLVVRLDVMQSSHVLQYRAVFKAEHPLVSMEAQSTGVGEIINSAMSVAAYETLRPEATYRQIGNVLNALNHQSICAAPELEDGAMLYVVFYEGAEPIFVLTNVENGALAMTSYIIPSAALADCSTYPEVAMWFMRWGCPISGAVVQPE